MLREIIVEEGIIQFELYYKRIKNLNLRVRRDGSVMVSAPMGLPQKHIDHFVASRAERILTTRDQMIDAHKKEHQERLPELNQLDQIHLLGVMKTIILCKGKRRVEEQKDRILIFLPNINEVGARQKVFLKWRKEQEELWLSRIFLSVYDHYFYDTPEQMPLPKLVLREMTSRWGSCRPFQGVITLNRKLIEYPVEAIEYVVLHEFVHYLEMNHSSRFYEQVALRMPDYKKRKSLLKREN